MDLTAGGDPSPLRHAFFEHVFERVRRAHPPAPNDKKLNNAKRGRVVAHVKALVKEPDATRASWPKGPVRRHGLSQPPRAGMPAWADLPPSRWALTPEECMPAAAV